MKLKKKKKNFGKSKVEQFLDENLKNSNSVTLVLKVLKIHIFYDFQRLGYVGIWLILYLICALISIISFNLSAVSP